MGFSGWRQETPEHTSPRVVSLRGNGDPNGRVVSGPSYLFSRCVTEGKTSMAFLFLLYFVTFLMLFLRKKQAAYVLFGASTLASIGMFLYHTNSVLKLNF